VDAYLGIDVGTTHVKVVALTPAGERSVARAPTPVGDDGAGPVHAPDAIVAIVTTLAREAMAALPGAKVRGACAASIGEEGVALDGAGRPLYPALAWYARRASATGERFRRDHDPAATYAVCGLPQDPIHTLFHWAWLHDRAPDVLRRMRSWLSVSEYVAYALCGVAAMSPSQASRTHLWSPFGGGWQGEWARAVGGDPDALPPVIPSGTILGPLRPAALAGVAVADDAVVVVGGHDHTMGAWAAGVRDPGEALDSLGTAESVFLIAGPRARPTARGRVAALQHGASVALPSAQRRHVSGALHSGAGIAAIARLFGRSLEELEREAAAIEPGSGGLRYAPPPWGEDPRGAFSGVPLETTPGQWFRAALEGWARAATVTLATVAREAHSDVARVVAIGGGSQIGLAMRIRASMLGCPLEVVAEPELVALGAATLAMAAVEPGAAPAPPARAPVEPVARWRAVYEARAGAGNHLDRGAGRAGR
jgi:xylulokinase